MNIYCEHINFFLGISLFMVDSQPCSCLSKKEQSSLRREEIQIGSRFLEPEFTLLSPHLQFT